MDILLKNVLAVDSIQGFEKLTDIAITDGKISAVSEDISQNAETVIDGKGRLMVCPGLFDMHVHFRDPGFTQQEDIITGTASAAAGGFTGVACMPNTNPRIDSAETIKYIINKSKSTGIDVFPVACITEGMNGNQLCDYIALKNAGAIAISDDGRSVENAELMRQALELSNDNGLTVISHCEDLNIIGKGIMNKGKTSLILGVAGMDRASEDYITAREIALASSCNAHIHIAHVSTKGAVEFIRDAKKNGYNVTAETCPHYFTYTEEKLLSRDADYRMNPPLRTEADKKAVLNAVLDGTIDCIVTDHAPHTKEAKADFEKAPNGVVGLETSLAVTLTQLYETKKATLTDIVRLMSENPRKVLKLEALTLKEGSIADLTVVDLDKIWTVEPHKLLSKSKNSVFKGEKLKGKVKYTISKGRIIFSDK